MIEENHRTEQCRMKKGQRLAAIVNLETVVPSAALVRLQEKSCSGRQKKTLGHTALVSAYCSLRRRRFPTDYRL